MLPCIAYVLKIVRTLLHYGRHLDTVLPTQAAHPRFPTLAAGFGTHDIRRIIAHIHRGILRAMMLERYLLARAAQGRDIEPAEPSGPAEPEEIEALDLKLRAPTQPSTAKRRRPKIDPDDPYHFAIPTLKELEAQVRRQSVGTTIAQICQDLGIAPTHCDSAFWNELYDALLHFGANIEQFYAAQSRRQETFQQERDKRPETWTIAWRERPKEAIRELLGTVLGESAPALG